ncbi:AhpC/TSA family protein [Polystyrenella longa]|uniref:AhpC/TSA family protein n=1 Tax=Polystyrenella longa TaxID=2528007 RepID=A0A518CKN1_9PLAN|nr:redoxin domain-containing protein [Polystyrenella longa]QDU79795.1 AhpC/TSA family protein [Polystyrenella longa]
MLQFKGELFNYGVCFFAIAIVWGFAGCSNQYGGYVSKDDPHFKNFSFNAIAETNTELPASPAEIELFNLEGEKVALSDYIGKKKTVLVVTRGNTVPICPFCSTQTSRYVMYYKRFQNMGAEVLLVYPIESEFTRDGIDQFLAESQQNHGWKQEETELPILIDSELELVNYLGIRKDLSKPSTYIFDESGEITFAYVGRDLTDRPSIQSVLDHLEDLPEVSSGEVDPEE